MAVKCSPRSNQNEMFVFMKGAINEVLKQSVYYNFHGTPELLTNENRKEFLSHADLLGSDGLRGIQNI